MSAETQSMLEEAEPHSCNCSLFDFLLRESPLSSYVIHSFDWKSAIEHDGGV